MSELMLRICADRNSGMAQFAWINFQKDGSISVGLNDRAFIPPDLGIVHGVWSAFNREALEYVVAHDPKAMKPLNSPHLTFHPPGTFHLTKGKGEKNKPFFGIGDVDLTVQQDGFMPWAKLVSKPISKLHPAAKARAGKIAEDIVLPKQNEESSLGLTIDFLEPTSSYMIEPPLLAGRTVRWHGRQILVAVEALQAQKLSTISWKHQF